MNKIKIFNDPVYGLVSFPHEILYDIIEHPYFQRLRRISQTGLTHLVYPGATHTRFHHALGALHLMTRAIMVLRSKGVHISDEESEAVCIAILLHDIGHGPFSHALEGQFLNVHHEDLSLAIMKMLNDQMQGRLTLAIEIFKGQYNRPFLYELVSSQLDMDRLDYLNRDSFYTGVAEGVIGYDRIISMLKVVDGHIVVEEKGVFSIEKFLIARKIMYWQVYLHKTVLSAEKMLVRFFKRFKFLYEKGTVNEVEIPSRIIDILNISEKFDMYSRRHISLFCNLDDIDIYMLLKNAMSSHDKILAFLATALINRKLHKIILSDDPIDDERISSIVNKAQKKHGFSLTEVENLIFTGAEKTMTYDGNDSKINILLRNNSIVEIDKISSFTIVKNNTIKHYICFPY